MTAGADGGGDKTNPMKNINDEAQFTDMERARYDKAKVKSKSHFGETKGKICLYIRRLELWVFFKSIEDLDRKRSRYEIEPYEGKIVMA